MQYASASSLKWANAALSAIDMMVVFPRLGDDPVPFTATPDDATEHGRELFARAVAGDFGPILPADPLPPVDLVAYAAKKRWEVETGGVTFAGAVIDTSRQSQAMISGAYAYSQKHPEKLICYKTNSGFVTLDAATTEAIATAVGDHVQACFAKEADVLDAITAGTITTTSQIDTAFASVAGNWP